MTLIYINTSRYVEAIFRVCSDFSGCDPYLQEQLGASPNPNFTASLNLQGVAVTQDSTILPDSITFHGTVTTSQYDPRPASYTSGYSILSARFQVPDNTPYEVDGSGATIRNLTGADPDAFLAPIGVFLPGQEYYLYAKLSATTRESIGTVTSDWSLNLSTIPEPSTFGLLMLGLALIARLKR